MAMMTVCDARLHTTVAATVTGVIMIPGAPQLKAKDIQYRVDNSHAKCIIGDSDIADKVDEVNAITSFGRTSSDDDDNGDVVVDKIATQWLKLSKFMFPRF